MGEIVARGRATNPPTWAAEPSRGVPGLADPEPERGQLSVLGDRGALQLDRRAARAAEERDAVPEQHGCDVHEDLVDQVRLEALPGDVGAEENDVAVLGRALRDRHRLLDRDVEEATRDSLDDGRF